MFVRKQSKMFWIGVILFIFVFVVMIFNFVTSWWLGGVIMLVCLIINLYYTKKNYRRIQ
jgi:L-asparagine transporter-like permease